MGGLNLQHSVSERVVYTTPVHQGDLSILEVFYVTTGLVENGDITSIQWVVLMITLYCIGNEQCRASSQNGTPIEVFEETFL